MNLIPERLNMLVNLEIVPKLLDVRRVLVLARQHGQRHLDLERLLGIQHGRVRLGADLELGARLAREQVHNLAAPAEAHDAPLLNLGVLGLDALEVVWDARDRLGGCALGAEEGAELGLVVVILRREPGDVGGFAVEEVWDEDAVGGRRFLRGENVGALEGLGEVAKDVVDEEDGFLGGGTGDV